jgi:GTPase SAR1 family protein
MLYIGDHSLIDIEQIISSTVFPHTQLSYGILCHMQHSWASTLDQFKSFVQSHYNWYSVCSKCNLNVVVEDEYHFILQCEKYIDVRRRYLKKYYWQMPSCFKLVQLLSVRNIKELNNLGIYLLLAEKIRNA